MDPPRAGSTEEFLTAVKTLAPKKLVYVSCNPVTLSRDLEFITKNGYEVRKIQPVDMFPFTDHCETVVLLVRKENKTFEKKGFEKKNFDKKPFDKNRMNKNSKNGKKEFAKKQKNT